MFRSLITTLSLALVLGSILVLSSSIAPGTKKSSKKDAIQWMSFEEALSKKNRKGKKIFIDVYTNWCGWCKKLDKNTFSDPKIIEYMNKHFLAVKFNAESKDSIQFEGKNYTFLNRGRRGYHELALKLCGRLSYPTLVILDEDFQSIRILKGYRLPTELDKVLKYYSEDHYLDTPYETYLETYVSPFEE